MCGIFLFSHPQFRKGGLAQLARALAWHARGHRFDSDILHKKIPLLLVGFFVFDSLHVD